MKIKLNLVALCFAVAISVAFGQTENDPKYKINPTPEIIFEDKTVKVNIVTFTKWGGFERNTYTINKNWPHKIINEEKETLVQYYCGMKF